MELIETRETLIGAFEAKKESDPISAAYDAASLLLSTIVSINQCSTGSFSKLFGHSRIGTFISHLRPDVIRFDQLFTIELRSTASLVHGHPLP
jgi:hypothetical protein